jgi:hypothetical protein
MGSPAHPKHEFPGTEEQPEKPQSSSSSDPIYLRHRHHGELGQMLREYYSNALDEPLPERLLRLIEQFRQKEQNK